MSVTQLNRELGFDGRVMNALLGLKELQEKSLVAVQSLPKSVFAYDLILQQDNGQTL